MFFKSLLSKIKNECEQPLLHNMGNCVPKADLAFKQNGFKKHAQEIHMTITREMTRTDEDIKVVRKFLLLGAGSCGKSTLFRQLKCIYGTGFEASDVLCVLRIFSSLS